MCVHSAQLVGFRNVPPWPVFGYSAKKTHATSWKQAACVQGFACVIRHGKAVSPRSEAPFGKAGPRARQEIRA